MRLSINNFAGMERTLVAVGTCNEASMLVTTRAAVPRSGSTCPAEGEVTTGALFCNGCAGSGSLVRGAFEMTDCGCAPGVAGVGVVTGERLVDADALGELAAVGEEAGVAAGEDVDGEDAEGREVDDWGVPLTEALELTAALFGAGGRPPAAGRVSPGGVTKFCWA